MILGWLALPALLMFVASFMRQSAWAQRGLPWSNLLIFIGIVQLFLQPLPQSWWGGLLVADRLNTWVLLISALVGVAVTLALAVLPLRVKISLQDYRRFYRFFAIFWIGLMLAVLANHMGLYWIGLEMATLGTVYMIRTNPSSAARQQTWNYMVIGTVAISMVLFGIVLIYASAKGGLGEEAMRFDMLEAHVDAVHSALLFELGFAITLLGLMIKLGFFPMNLWLPNIERAAFYPVAALFSGILESAVMLGFFRFSEVALVVSPSHTHILIITFTLLTLVVVAALIFHVKDLMRLFALSGIEHMALIALFWATGGKFAALLHLSAHTFMKPALFLATGVLEQQGRYRFRGVLSGFESPMGRHFVELVGLFMMGLIALPPSPLFFTELQGLGAFYQSFSPFEATLLSVGVLLPLAVIFYKFVEIWQQMRHAQAPSANKQVYWQEWLAISLLSLSTAGLWLQKTWHYLEAVL